MFAKGSNKAHNIEDRGPFSRPNPKVYIDTYDAKFEDFSSSMDPSATDSWVFDKVEEFFDHALEGEDQELRLKLRDDKIVLFLHLLGLDTNGHTRKPNSPEHEENIRLVDEGVKRYCNECRDIHDTNKNKKCLKTNSILNIRTNKIF